MKKKLFQLNVNKKILLSNKKSKKKNYSEGTIDYKNVVLLRKFISAEGKILPRRLTGVTAKQQRQITRAIKNSRMVGLLPFINYSNSF
jgi:small subunit ribosomal protein S18